MAEEHELQEDPATQPLTVESKNTENLPPKFSLTYGFYVIMGGLTVDVSDIYDTLERATLTPGGVLDLASGTSWKHFFEEDRSIRDRSKANWFAKSLVILQVTYTAFQCIARTCVGLPLTVLEIHTLVHAVCAMIMYSFWWDKPLDISDAKRVDTSTFSDEVALAMMRSTGSAFYPFTTFRTITFLQSWRQCGLLGPLTSRKIWQSWNIASEASFLLFDGPRRDIALESLEISNVHAEDISTLCEVDNVRLEANDTQTEGGTGVDSTQLDDPDPIKNIAFVYQPTLIWLPPVDSPTAIELKTGQVLTSGVGPAGFLHSASAYFFMSNGFTMTSIRSTRSKGGLQVHKIPKTLECLIRRHCNPISSKECYGMKFCLSQKGLLRWHRAGRAFAKELLRSSTENAASHPIEGSMDGADSPSSAQSRRLRWDTEKPLASLHHFEKDHKYGFALTPFSVLPDNFQNAQGTLMGNASASAIVLIGGVYAGVHLALWNHHFPTRVEGLLWKIAGCTLGSPIGLFAALFVLTSIASTIYFPLLLITNHLKAWNKANAEAQGDRLKRWWQRALDPVKNLLSWIWNGLTAGAEMTSQVWKKWWKVRWFKITAMITAIVLILPVFIAVLAVSLAFYAAIPLYILSRMYIIVESLISLRRVAIEVYEGVTWAQYIPHF